MNRRFRTLLHLAGLILFMVSSVEAEELPPKALIQGDHWKRARASLEARLAVRPDDASALCLLAKVKVNFGEPDAALKLAERAVALNPGDAECRCILAEISGSLMGHAGIFAAAGFLRTFKSELKTALALDPKNIAAREALIGFHWNGPALAGADKGTAQVLAQEILAIDAERGYLVLAMMASAEKNKETIEQLYLKALNSNPNSYRANMSLANLYSSQPGRQEAAEKYARAALKLDPSRSSAYVTLARLLTEQHRWQDLDRTLADSEKNVFDDLYPFYHSGLLLLTEGNEMQRSESYFRKYLTQPPEATRPSPARAHWRLGLVLEKQKRNFEALEELRTATQMDPLFDPAKKDLDRLK